MNYFTTKRHENIKWSKSWMLLTTYSVYLNTFSINWIYKCLIFLHFWTFRPTSLLELSLAQFFREPQKIDYVLEWHFCHTSLDFFRIRFTVRHDRWTCPLSDTCSFQRHLILPYPTWDQWWLQIQFFVLKWLNLFVVIRSFSMSLIYLQFVNN